MKTLKLIFIASLASAFAMPVYAHQYGHDGHSRYEKRHGHYLGHDIKSHKHHKYHKHHRGHRHGWHKKPYGLYKKHRLHRRPHYGYHNHGHGYFDNDGWELILRLSDDF